MLWHKTWLETRSRFFIGLAVLTVVAAGTVMEYRQVQALMPTAQDALDRISAQGAIGVRIREAFELQREYRGYVWLEWFRQNLSQMGTLFAVLLGSGGAVGAGTGGAALFTLSLPVSRRQVLGTRAAAGLTELLALVFVPSLLIFLLSPSIGEHFGFGATLVHGLCAFLGGAVFFSLAVLMSTLFNDLWRPMLFTCLIAVLLALAELLSPDLSAVGIFHLMSGELFFKTGQLPWLGLLASAGVAAGLLYGAALSLESRDF